MTISGSVSETDLPLRVVVDHHGHYWRDYGDYLSMCPVSDENNETVVAAVYVREVCEDEARHATGTERNCETRPNQTHPQFLNRGQENQT